MRMLGAPPGPARILFSGSDIREGAIIVVIQHIFAASNRGRKFCDAAARPFVFLSRAHDQMTPLRCLVFRFSHSPKFVILQPSCAQVNGLGGVNEGALVMEYLDGTEYVVDSVSRDGVHRIISIWEYDKRSVNGANFVYFGMELKPATAKVWCNGVEEGAR